MVKLNNGFLLTFSASSDARISDCTYGGGAYYITAKSPRFADEIARECEAWGARVERIGAASRDIVVSG